jgi:L-threonylcarbamoyladenylate synthase
MRQTRSRTAGALIDLLEQPLIATSANISRQPTCHSGIQTFAVMDGRIDLVLDGGISAGAGATTVDITEPYWRLIKPGTIPEKEIAECLKGS